MLKKLILALVTFALAVCLLEVGARLIESQLDRPPTDPGWQTRFFAGMFSWHEPDPRLLWRFRPNLVGKLIHTNADGLIAGPVSKRKPDSTLRVLLLGDSSPVGLGLQSYRESFGDKLQYLLQKALLGRRKVELINSAVSGYSSEQCRLFLELDGWQYEPDIVVVYCGNNDASISGFASDRDLLGHQQLVGLRRTLSHLAIYRLLRTALAPAGHSRNSDSQREPVVRVTAAEYGENIRTIVEQCDTRHVPVVIVKPAVPYLWPAGLQFAVFTDIPDDSGRLLQAPELREALGRDLKYCLDSSRLTDLRDQPDWFARTVYAVAYRDTLSPEQAVEHYRRLAETRPDDPVALNNLGVSLWQVAEYDLADTVLRDARRLYVRSIDDTGATSGLTPFRQAVGAPFLFNIASNSLRGAIIDFDIRSVDSVVAMPLFDSALQADYFSLRIKRAYWNEIDRLAQAQKNRQVIVIDLPALFLPLGNETMFVDQCHPTALGHSVIAEAVFDSLSARGLIGE